MRALLALSTFYRVSCVSYSDWLSQFQNTLIVNLPVIPGSHNSGSISPSDSRTSIGAWQYAQTQTLSIEEQLELGIRFLDLRLHVYFDVVDVDDSIVISHTVDSNLTLTSVLEQVASFLLAHPTEFVIMYLRIDPAHPLQGNISSKQEFIRETIVNSSVSLSNFGNGNVSTLRVQNLAGKVLLLGPDGVVLPASSSSFAYVDSTTNYSVCDIWEESSITNAQSTLSDCFPKVPLSGTVSGILNGYALDGFFNNQPPLETSRLVNDWFFGLWSSNPIWIARRNKPIGILLIDDVNEENMTNILQGPVEPGTDTKGAFTMSALICIVNIFMH